MCTHLISVHIWACTVYTVRGHVCASVCGQCFVLHTLTFTMGMIVVVKVYCGCVAFHFVCIMWLYYMHVHVSLETSESLYSVDVQAMNGIT